MPSAVTSTIVLCARALLVCSVHHQIVGQNVSSIRIVHRIVPVNRNVAKIRVSVHAASMLAAPHKIISQLALASKVTKEIRTPVAHRVKVSLFSVISITQQYMTEFEIKTKNCIINFNWSRTNTVRTCDSSNIFFFCYFLFLIC